MQDTKFDNFIEFLKIRFDSPLPARQAHEKMAPVLNNEAFRRFEPEAEPYKSAVLIVLFDDNGSIGIILTLRSSKLKSHSGQISLPGGRKEDDETLVETALREAEEEIGLDINNVEILGSLSNLYVPPSNNMIAPVVCYLKNKQEFVKNEDEVAEIFFVNLPDLAGDKLLKREIWQFKGLDVTVPHWNVHSTTPLWGATAMILSELIELFKEYKLTENE